MLLQFSDGMDSPLESTKTSPLNEQPRPCSHETSAYQQQQQQLHHHHYHHHHQPHHPQLTDCPMAQYKQFCPQDGSAYLHARQVAPPYVTLNSYSDYLTTLHPQPAQLPSPRTAHQTMPVTQDYHNLGAPPVSHLSAATHLSAAAAAAPHHFTDDTVKPAWGEHLGGRHTAANFSEHSWYRTGHHEMIGKSGTSDARFYYGRDGQYNCGALGGNLINITPPTVQCSTLHGDVMVGYEQQDFYTRGMIDHVSAAYPKQYVSALI